ncbi:MAG: hypothetical protein ACYTEO_13820 [Planctomycetota bacterium]|jgi:hypothetical protein
MVCRTGKGRWTFIVVMMMPLWPGTNIGWASPHSGTTLLEVRAFPVKGETKKLEPQILDFRYAPYRWQACIGLPDDPHKSIVGSDGGLYYEYGGGPYYDFKTRILAKLDAKGGIGKIRQSLRASRVPIVITEQNTGDLALRQEAWAGAPEEESIQEWSTRRVDYLWLKMKNQSNRKATGRIIVQVASNDRLILNEQHNRLLKKDNPDKTFCTISPACASVEYSTVSDTDILIDHQPSVNRRWAQPKVSCDRRFCDILVGWRRPLVLTYRAGPKKKYRVAFGLIEGWHKQPGMRLLEIRIEGQVVRSVDLVNEYGQNKPVVFCFDAEDQNKDGIIEMGVHSPKQAEDKNTILSGLWIFEPNNAPSKADILAGGIDDKALAVMDVDKVPRLNSLKLVLQEKQLDSGEEYRALLTFYQGKQASAQTTEKQAAREQQRAINYWKKIDLPYDRMLVPDPAVQGLLDSCIRNIYQARELRDGHPAFQVGPTCYRGTWAADGPFILEAITYLGRAMEGRAGLEQQIDKDSGPAGVAFSKKAGLRLWMIWRHAQLTGDTAWLEKMWPRVEREVKQIIKYRSMTKNDPNQANYGLMPIGFGDGGLGGMHREYTNVYWTLAGLQAAIEMADKMNKPMLLAWKAEYQDYWKVFKRARDRDKLVDDTGNVYVPVTMKGEQKQLPQRGSWAFLQSVFPGRIFEMDDQLMLGTMAMLDATQKEGLIYGTGWLPDGIWNYAASFYGHAHLWLGHGKKTASTLYAFGNHACPLLCWREEQNVVGEKENYCGDMPHNWASAEFIRMVRHVMILERDRELHLLQGLPHNWTKPEDETRMVEIPTSFGEMTLSLKMSKDGKSAILKVEPPRREVVEKIVVHLENFERPVKTVRLGNKKLRYTAADIRTNKGFLLKVDFKD